MYIHILTPKRRVFYSRATSSRPKKMSAKNTFITNMAPAAVDSTADENEEADQQQQQQYASSSRRRSHPAPPFWSRESYSGALLFNIFSFLLPALYATLSKLWIANIDSSRVVTTDVYTYIGVVTEVLNEGLPRAAWTIIGDKANRTLSARQSLSYTLIIFQAVLGVIMSVILTGSARQFAAVFVPVDVREVSLTYVRISAFSALASALETAVGAATRALDKPDVPLIVSSTKFAVNIVLDMVLISKFHVSGITPTVNIQAATQLVCNLVAAVLGLVYFVWSSMRELKSPVRPAELEPAMPTFKALVTLARPGAWTFIESAVRNALYLWLVSGIVAMGSEYATAWGVFNTIRWGLVMVPVQALEATTLTFVGHNWGSWRRLVGINERRPTASRQQLRMIIHPALRSCLIALAVEIPMCLFLSFYGARRFAWYLSESVAVSLITAKMWKTIDWCYICYAVSTQLAAILLGSRPRWYLYQSLASNLLWVLPWAIAMQNVNLKPEHAWTYHSVVFGGSMVFSLADIILVDAGWAYALLKGKMMLSILD